MAFRKVIENGFWMLLMYAVVLAVTEGYEALAEPGTISARRAAPRS